MADNIDVTPGTGKTIAADEIGGSLHQRIKLVIGDDGVNDGDVSAANPLPITGTVSATNPSVGVADDPSPASAALIGWHEVGSGELKKVTDFDALPVQIVAGAMTVTGSVDAAQAGAWSVSVAAGATDIGKAEDAASASGDVGVPAMAIQQSSPANTAANGDYAMLQMSAGRLWTEAIIEDGGNSITVDGAISFTAPQHIIVDSGTVTTVSTVTTITNVVHVDDNSGSLTVDGTLKTAYGTATAFTKTNANLAASVTAGWKSNAIDNTSTKALDALVGVELAAVNTAPAGTKTLYLYAYGLIEGTAYTSTGDGTIDGTEGTLTFPSVTTLQVVLRLIGTVPYPVQNRAINGGPFSVAAVFGGILPDKWGVAMVNDTGMTLSVTNIYYQEITNTLG